MRAHKHILYKVAVLLAAPLLLDLASCSDISPNERTQYLRPANVARGVLIEDFTGQRCLNCPNASNEIAKLQQQYGDSVVVAVGIHSGPLGFAGSSKLIGFATDTGNDYYNHWKVPYQPAGMVDRHGVENYTSWAESVRNELQKEAPIKLTVTNNFDSATRTLTVCATAYPLTNTSISGKLQLWLVEDSITAYQKMPDGTNNFSYLHRHVFRKAINDAWGTAMPVPADNMATATFSTPVPTDWNEKQLSVVAFLYNDSGVLQVITKHL